MTAFLPITTLSLIIAPGSILASIASKSSIGIAEFLLSFSTLKFLIRSLLFNISSDIFSDSPYST